MNKPIRLSYSGLTNYQGCPYCYKLTYIDKVPLEVTSNPAAAFGTSIHDLLEWWYNDGNFDLRSLLLNFNNFFEKEMNKPEVGKVDKSYKEFLRSRAPTMLRHFYQRQKMDGLLVKPISTEIAFAVPWKDSKGREVLLTGRVDLIIRGEDGVEIDDYKTAMKLPPDGFIETNHQLTYYSMGYRWLRRQEPERFKDLENKVVLHYLQKNVKLESVRGKKHYMDLLKQVEQTLDGIYGGVFPKKPSVTSCQWCDYKGIHCDSKF